MLNVLICDDRREDAAALAKALAKMKDGVRAVYITPGQLEDYKFDGQTPVIVILEIIFENRSGLELAKRIRKRAVNAYMIFMSTHVELIMYLLAGNVIPAGFIQKPIRHADAETVLGNVISLCRGATDGQYLAINISGEQIKIPRRDIMYIEAQEKKIFVHTTAKRYSCYNTLSALAGELGGQFVRCYKSYIINAKRVKEVSYVDMLVTMENGVRLPISRGFKQEVKRVFPDE